MDLYKNEPSDYGLALRAYPNNQPPVVIDYINFRSILQLFGTEAMKPYFGDHIWAELAEKEAHRLGGTIIIPDFRFKIEDEVWNLDKYNVITIRIQDDNLTMTDSHASEVDLLDYEFDYYINNTDKNSSVLNELNEIIEWEGL